jgi:hypothetical protein
MNYVSCRIIDNDYKCQLQGKDTMACGTVTMPGSGPIVVNSSPFE